MTGCNPCHVPMGPQSKLNRVSSEQSMDAPLYRSIIDMLCYIVHTLSDLSCPVGYVSPFIEVPTTEHLNVVNRVLRYLMGTLQ